MKYKLYLLVNILYLLLVYYIYFSIIPATAITPSFLSDKYQSFVTPRIVQLWRRLLLTSEFFKFSNSAAISSTKCILIVTLLSMNLPSLLHCTSTWPGLRHPFCLQICSDRLESFKKVSSENSKLQLTNGWYIASITYEFAFISSWHEITSRSSAVPFFCIRW